MDNSKQYDDEIDLLELFQTIWDGKGTIFTIIMFSVFSILGYVALGPSANFVATTQVKPISTAEIEKYRQSNELGFFVVNQNQLLDHYVEQLELRILFEKAFKKYKLLDIKDFESKNDYQLAIDDLLASIELKPPINVDGKEKGESRRFWTVKFEFNDKEKWISVLSEVNKEATNSVRNFLANRFNEELIIANKKHTFELEDLTTRIKNTKEDYDKKMAEFLQTTDFAIEDINIKIENALKDYDRKTKDRLAFLKEQALIARKLGVSNNTIEANKISSENSFIATVQTKVPFYLRGFKAIEKEIDLISKRTNKNSFVSGLYDLEKQKRDLEQDKTVQRAEKKKEFLEELISLEQKIRGIEQDQRLVRAKALFKLTPIVNKTDFSAANVNIGFTEFEYKRKLSLLLAVAIVISGFIGIFFVLISNSLRKRKNTEKL